MIKNDYQYLLKEYKKHHFNLKDIGEDYYYQIRDRFNQDKNPIDFYFLTRTCANGLIRYNQQGNFNTSFHLTRWGIKPKNLEPILKKMV